MDLIVLRRLKAQTQPAARQHIRLEDLANVGAYTAHSGESDHAPALGELPALLHLQGEHVLVPVTPGFIAAQVVAGAEKAEIDDRHIPAGETASSPRSEDDFVEHLPKVVETDPPISVVEVGQKLADKTEEETSEIKQLMRKK